MIRKPRSGTWPVLVFAAWTLYVWGNRIANALGNASLGAAGKAFSVALSLTVLAGGIAAGAIAVRAWSRPWSPREALIVQVAAGWTVVLWLVLVPKILIDGRPAGFTGNLTGFKAVHATLGLISVVIAGFVWRATRRATRPVGQESLQPVSPG